MPLPTPRDCIDDRNDGTEPCAANFLYPNAWTQHRKVCVRERDAQLPLGRGASFGGGGVLANCGPVTVLFAAGIALLVLNHFARWTL